MPIYELTYTDLEGNWPYFRIEAPDFHAACENALQGAKARQSEGYRLSRIEVLPEAATVPQGK